MAKTAKKTNAKAKANSTAKTAKAEKPKADKATPEQAKPLTMLQAAEKVLAGAKAPMTCIEIVRAMKAQGLWETKTGLTPQNTLNAAINRHMKKEKSPFTKPEKGKYAIAS